MQEITHPWLRTVFPIAAIFSFRLLGLFMLIPVFTLYAIDLKDATPQLMGLTLGIYGLSQSVLQIPLGVISDIYGRKPIIIVGLTIFLIGSLIGAYSHSIWGVMLARALQGMGAIGGVLIALLADVTDEASRSKAMAVIGATIGLSFSIAMIISPIIAQYHGLSGIFYISTILACTALFLTICVIPNSAYITTRQTQTALIKIPYISGVLNDKSLQLLNYGIFFQHFIFTATFFVLPLLLKQPLQHSLFHQTWHFYLTILGLSFILMLPLLKYTEKHNKTTLVFAAMTVLTSISQALLSLLPHHLLILFIETLIYFIAFNYLEAMLPSMISKQAPTTSKGTAMGIYTTAQFFGIFLGGITAGVLYQYGGIIWVLRMNTIIGLLWCFINIQQKSSKNALT